MSKLELSLVENAFDFFLEAIDQIDQTNPKKLKFSILNMASAVELILKAKLQQEHWALIFRDPSKASWDYFEKGNFRSADFQDVQDRIEAICKIRLSKHKTILKKLREMRNRLQHFAYSGQVMEITSVLTKTWSFLWDFIHDHLPEEAEEQEARLNEIRERMARHEVFIKQRFNEIKGQLDEAKEDVVPVISCPSCLQDTLIIPGGEAPTCCFCRYEREPVEVADDWATVFVGYPHTDPKERMIEPVLKECPECGQETMIEFEDDSMIPPDPAWVCFSCGESGPPMVICHNCGEEFPWEGEVYICPDCRGEEETNE